MSWVRSSINDLQFRLREQFLGKVQLRGRFPRASSGRSPELDFYHFLLTQAYGTPRIDFDVVIDIGCRNWSYVPALAEFFPAAKLLGVEVDGSRRHWNLHRRRDYAEAHARGIPNDRAQCHFGDFTTVSDAFFRDLFQDPGKKLLFTFFYPFVSDEPCLAWGLPRRFADFSKLLSHAGSLAAKWGARADWMSVHQGEWEGEPARDAYQNHGRVPQIKVLRAESFEKLWPARHDIHLFLSQDS